MKSTQSLLHKKHCFVATKLFIRCITYLFLPISNIMHFYEEYMKYF